MDDILAIIRARQEGPTRKFDAEEVVTLEPEAVTVAAGVEYWHGYAVSSIIGVLATLVALTLAIGVWKVIRSKAKWEMKNLHSSTIYESPVKRSPEDDERRLNFYEQIDISTCKFQPYSPDVICDKNPGNNENTGAINVSNRNLFGDGTTQAAVVDIGDDVGKGSLFDVSAESSDALLTADNDAFENDDDGSPNQAIQQERLGANDAVGSIPSPSVAGSVSNHGNWFYSSRRFSDDVKTKLLTRESALLPGQSESSPLVVTVALGAQDMY